MTGQLIVEAGAAETRSALVVDGRVRRFFFAPARGDENLPRAAEAGDIFLARTKSHGAGGAFLDIGQSNDAFLPVGKSKLPPIGSALIVRITRPALREKGAIASIDWRKAIAPGHDNIEAKAASAAKPVRLSVDTDAALSAFRSLDFSQITEVIASTHEAARCVSAFVGDGIEVVIDANAWERLACDEALEVSLARCAPLPGGGRMIIDEAAALTAIDIDGGPTERDRRAMFNEAGAGAVFLEIVRRSIGGQIVIDFPAPTGGKDRAALSALLARLQRETIGGRPGRLGHGGLFYLVVPRTEKSLLERASRFCGNGWLRPGRTFNQHWLSVEAVRALERVLRKAPNGRPRLRASRSVYSYLEARHAWLDRLVERYGDRFSIEALVERSADTEEDIARGGFEIAE